MPESDPSAVVEASPATDANRGYAADVELACTGLREHGYKQVSSHGELAAGMRVRHGGEQYWQALDNGTAQVMAVFMKDPSPWSQKYGRPDVEVVVLKDKPMLPDMSPVHTWANYHTVPVANRSSASVTP